MRYATTSIRSTLARPPTVCGDITRLDELVEEVRSRTAKLAAVRSRWFDRRPTPTAPPSTRAITLLRDDDPTFALEAIAALLDRALDA